MTLHIASIINTSSQLKKAILRIRAVRLSYLLFSGSKAILGIRSHSLGSLHSKNIVRIQPLPSSFFL